MKKVLKELKKPLKRAGISGIILLIFVISYNFFAQFISLFPLNPTTSKIMLIFYILGTTILGISFTYGFIVLGRKYKIPLLIFVAWAGIIIASIISLFLIFGILFPSNIFTPTENPNSAELNALLPFFFLNFPFFVIVFGIYSILLGVGLLKIKKRIKFAKSTGVLNILAGATYLFLVGFLLLIATEILTILMFFNASKKLEE